MKHKIIQHAYRKHRLKLFVGIILSVLVFFSFIFVDKTQAVAGTCTAAVGLSDWNTPATWSGSGCDGLTEIPEADDAVVIPAGSAVNITVAGAVAASISMSDPASLNNNAIVLFSPATLTVGGDITIVGSSGSRSSAFNVSDGVVSVANISITGGASTGTSAVVVGTNGTMNVSGNISFAGAAGRARVAFSGNGTLNIEGNFGSEGTLLTVGGFGTINFNGSSAQTMGTYTTYNNVIVTNTSGDVTLDGSIKINGTLVVNDGSLDSGVNGFTVMGTTTVNSSGTLLFSSDLGTKIFTGNVLVDGGIWNETAAATIAFWGDLTNNATSFTTSTGVHSFNATGTLSGTSETNIPNLAIYAPAIITNNSILSVNTELSGDGNLTNGATGTLNIGDTTTISTLTANAVGNIVNYIGEDQTVYMTDYYNLYFNYGVVFMGGDGVNTKTIADPGITIANNLFMSNGAQASLVLGTSTANALYLDGVLQLSGIWGSTASGATHINDTNFSGVGLLNVATGDDVPPTVTVTTSNNILFIGETFTITYTFSKVPVNFTTADVTSPNGTIDAITATGDPLVFTSIFTPSTDTIDNSNVITVGTAWQDGVGNTGVGDDSPNYTVYTIAPPPTGSNICPTGSIGIYPNCIIPEICPIINPNPIDVCPNDPGIQTTLPCSNNPNPTDVCPGEPGIQTTLPCPNNSNSVDVCPNISDIQLTIPNGMYLNNSSECVLNQNSTDFCPNISGDQIAIPNGMHLNNSGDCVPNQTSIDLCPNITGNQSTIPSGMHLSNNGNCVTDQISTDLCPNISNDQLTIPTGMELNNNGECVLIGQIIDVYSDESTDNLPTDGILDNSLDNSQDNNLTSILNENLINSPIQELIENTFSSGTISRMDTGLRTSSVFSLILGMVASIFSLLILDPIAVQELLVIRFRLWSLFLTALGLRKKVKPWGVVYDSQTKQPLDPVYVSLFQNGVEITSCITDIDGRYGFLVPPGTYKIVSKKTNYMFPSKVLAGHFSDELYHDLYFGEEIKVSDGEVIANNIPMDQEHFDWNEFAKNKKQLLQFYSKGGVLIGRISAFLFGIGMILAIITLLAFPKPYNVAIFSLYAVILLLQRTSFKKKTKGSLMEKDKEEPLSFAIVRIFSTATNVEIAHKVADNMGRYFCLVPNGNYYIEIEKKKFDGTYAKVYKSGNIEVTKGIVNRAFVV
ncbi:MAG: Ig-like domain-containing protein [Candidatus Paceibacterota bacterium]|jgi:hypothetical protein